MASRRVTYSVKDEEWRIVSLCNENEAWSPRSVSDVTRDIESGEHRYFVGRAGHRTEIRVVWHRGEKLLVADLNPKSDNNLNNLLAFLPPRRRTPLKVLKVPSSEPRVISL